MTNKYHQIATLEFSTEILGQSHIAQIGHNPAKQKTGYLIKKKSIRPMVFCQGTSPKVDQAAPDRRLPGPGGCTLTQLLEGGGVALDRRSHQGLLLNDGSDRRHEKDEEKSHRSSEDLGNRMRCALMYGLSWRK